MAEYKPQAVKDVPANEFIQAYAAHLKSTDKVSNLQPSHTWSSDSGGFFSSRTLVTQLGSDWVILWLCSATPSSRNRCQHGTAATAAGSPALFSAAPGMQPRYQMNFKAQTSRVNYA